MIKTRAVISKWAEGLEQAVAEDWRKAQQAPNPERAFVWNGHDQDLKNIVHQYNNALAVTPGYTPLDWHLIKAMLFVETNAQNKDWVNAPMQSAYRHDLGYGALMSDPTRLNLIVPPGLRGGLATPNASAADNITAGVGYLLFRAAQFGQATAITNPAIKTVTVAKGDTLDSIAAKNQSTEKLIRNLNPFVNFYPLKIGTVVKYQTAEVQTVITGWQSISPESISSMYNANGRGLYAGELRDAYDLIKQTQYLQ